MEQLALDDPAERLQLPQIREMVEEVLDGISTFLPTFPPPTANEVERIARHSSTLLARRPVVQMVIKRWMAPGLLAAACAKYLLPRLSGAAQERHRRQALIAAGAQMRNAAQPQPNEISAQTEAPAPQTAVIAQEAQPLRPSPAMAAAVAQHAQGIIDSARAGIPQ